MADTHEVSQVQGVPGDTGDGRVFVENSHEAVAKAKPGQWVRNSTGEAQLTQGDINFSRQKIAATGNGDNASATGNGDNASATGAGDTSTTGAGDTSTTGAGDTSTTGAGDTSAERDFIEDSDEAVANAKPGQWLKRNDGTEVQLKLYDINLAREKLHMEPRPDDWNGDDTPPEEEEKTDPKLPEGARVINHTFEELFNAGDNDYFLHNGKYYKVTPEYKEKIKRQYFQKAYSNRTEKLRAGDQWAQDFNSQFQSAKKEYQSAYAAYNKYVTNHQPVPPEVKQAYEQAKQNYSDMNSQRKTYRQNTRQYNRAQRDKDRLAKHQKLATAQNWQERHQARKEYREARRRRLNQYKQFRRTFNWW